MHAVQNTSAPAYDGARFDVDGFCIAHADVRLSKLSDGKYKIVRKICSKCGSATLARNMKSHDNRRKTMFSREVPSGAVQSRRGRRKSMSCRAVPSEVLAAGDGNRIGAGHHAKKTQRRQSAKAERRSSLDLAARTKRSQPSDRKSGSPRSRRQSLSLLPKSPPTSQNRRLSVSEIAKKKVADEKIKGVICLVPPPKTSTEDGPSKEIQQSRGINGSNNNKRSQTPSRKGCALRIRRHSISSLLSTSLPTIQENRRSSISEMAKKQVTDEKMKELLYLMPPQKTSNKDDPSKRHQKSSGVPFDGNGYCRAHPNVRLAKKNPEGGVWEIVSGVCPQCCVSAVMACQKNQSLAKSKNNNLAEKNLTKEVIGKVLTVRSDDSYKTWLTSEFSSNPTTPKPVPKPTFSADYFTSSNRNVLGLALDLERSERLVLAELNEAGVDITVTQRKGGRERTERKVRSLFL